MRVFILLLLLLMQFAGYAQKRGYKPGYIITHKNDTLRGWIQDRSPEPFVDLYERIRFVKEGKKRRKKYDANAIKGYGYENVHFLSVPYQEERIRLIARHFSRPQDPRQFFKVIAHAEKLIYYELEFVHDDNSFVDAIPFFHTPEKGEMVRVTQGVLGYKKKRLAEYFNRCPGLSGKLEEVDMNTLYTFLLQNCSH